MRRNEKERNGTMKERLICIGGYMFIALFSLILDSLIEFFFLAFMVGLFQGAIQALSRSYFGKMVPKDKTGEMFGILDIFGKGATIIGTLAVSAMTLISGEVRYIGLVLFVMFVIGLLFFIRSTRIQNYDVVITE